MPQDNPSATLPRPVDNDLFRDPVQSFTTNGRHTIQLIVGREDAPSGLRKFIVSRPHVISLSARFKQIITQRTSRTLMCTKNTKPIVLPEDDAEIMRLIMLIAHLKANQLPQKLDICELIRLARTVERYDISHILVPHLDIWLAHYRARILEPGYEQWLFVAYHFGLEEDYLLLANHLALNCRVDEIGVLLMPTTNRRFIGSFPFRTLQIIMRRRLRVIAHMLRAVYSLLDDMRISEHCKISHAPRRKQMQCTALNKLRLERYLLARGTMPPLQHTSAILLSPVELMKRLLNGTIVEVDPPPSDPNATSDSAAEFMQYDQLHEDCEVGTKLKKKIESSMENRLLAADIEIMDKIKERSRLYNRAPFMGYDEEKLPPRNDDEDVGRITREAVVLRSSQHDSKCMEGSDQSGGRGNEDDVVREV